MAAPLDKQVMQGIPPATPAQSAQPQGGTRGRGRGRWQRLPYRSSDAVSTLSPGRRQVTPRQQQTAMTSAMTSGGPPRTVAPVKPVAGQSLTIKGPSQCKFDELAEVLSRAVCITHISTDTEKNSDSLRAEHTTRHNQLFQDCLKLPDLGNHGEYGVPLALNLLDPELLGETQRSQLQAMKEYLSRCGTVGGSIEDILSEMSGIADSRPLEVMPEIARLYRQWRPLLTRPQLEQLAKVYRKILPAVLEQCQLMSDTVPIATERYFQKTVMLFLDIQYYGLTADKSAELKSLVEDTVHKVLTYSIMNLKRGELSVHGATAYRHQIQYCLDRGGLNTPQGQRLNTLVAFTEAKAVKPEAERAQALCSELEALLKAGSTYVALTRCIDCMRQQPEQWSGPQHSHHYGYLKRALKGQLASLCLQLSQQGINTATVQRIQTLLDLLKELKEAPWLVGHQNSCTLNALHALASDHITPQFAPPSDSDYPPRQKGVCEVSEAELQQILAVKYYKNNFHKRVVIRREVHLTEAQQWLELLNKRFSSQALSGMGARDKYRLEGLYNDSMSLVINDIFRKMELARVMGDRSRECMGKIAVYVVDQLFPLLNHLGSTEIKKRYEVLIHVLYPLYLTPLSSVIAGEMWLPCADRNIHKLKQLFAETHKVSALYSSSTLNYLTSHFFNAFPYQPLQIIESRLYSGSVQIVNDMLLEFEEMVLDKQFFYFSKDATEACKGAIMAIDLVLVRLNVLACQDSINWGPIQQRFLKKYYATGFSNRPIITPVPFMQPPMPVYSLQGQGFVPSPATSFLGHPPLHGAVSTNEPQKQAPGKKR